MASTAYSALMIRSCPRALQGTTLMLSSAVAVAAGSLANRLGTLLYDDYGGFTTCVSAMVTIAALTLPCLLFVPREVVEHADGEEAADHPET